MKAFEHISVGSVGEAVAFLGEQRDPDHTKIIAGGTDLLTLMNDGLLSPKRLINLKTARYLRSLRFTEDGAHIGALTTLADLERSSEIARRFPILLQSVREVATPQLRAMATVAGNLLQRPRCWYFRGSHDCWLKGGDQCFAVGGDNRYHAILGRSACVAVHPSDVAPVLIALDAQVSLEGPSGVRSLPVEDFFKQPGDTSRIEYTLQPGEVITEIFVPTPPEGASGAFLKMMERQAWAFALASAAAQLSLRDGVVRSARLVLGGVATVPWRVPQAEELLTNQLLTPALAKAAAEAAIQPATPLSHNSYKVTLVAELARRAILLAAGRSLALE